MSRGHLYLYKVANFASKESGSGREHNKCVGHPSVTNIVRNSRSRSGSPAASCYDLERFEKEKSPFLAVKSLLKPIKKSKMKKTYHSGVDDAGVDRDQQIIQDFRKLSQQLKPRTAESRRKTLIKVKDTNEISRWV